MWGISRLAEELLAFQEGMYSAELFSQLRTSNINIFLSAFIFFLYP